MVGTIGTAVFRAICEVTLELVDKGAACYTFSIPKFDGQRVKAVINRPNDEAISR